VTVAVPGLAFLRRKSRVISWSGLVALRIVVNASTLGTGVPSTLSMASPTWSLPADGPGSVTFSTVTALAYLR